MLEDKTIILKNLTIEEFKKKKLFLPDENSWINKTLLHMGYPDLNRTNAMIIEMVKATSESVKALIKPSFLFKTIPLESYNKKGFQTKSFNIKSNNWGKIASYLCGTQYVCCFAFTLGIQCEEKIKELGSDSIMPAFIWDALLSTMAEHFADQTEAFIKYQFIKQGMSITRRFSPGYCDLEFLQGQTALFNFCKPEKIGIKINKKSGLMIPRKSITGFVIAAEKVPYTQPCDFCTRNCKDRRLNN